MILIITHPEPLPNETILWQELLAAGADALLLRRPHWGPDEYGQVLTQTDPACYDRILIAGHWQLYQRFGLMGVHLSENLRNSTPRALLEALRHQRCCLSTGIHSTVALPGAGDPWDLVLLSPVFDSISKPGYKGQFNSGFRLVRDGGGPKLLALGGVNATNAAQARQMGFDGIALLGAIWQQPAQAVEQFHAISQQWNANAHM
ncbi:thiamine phosphate synthase [Chitinophaga agrisoli]|uniref:Thiamine phosphate synthase n=1 Tax=Chitinophaga agrisoli TaxID=2607653 RepID=A0A5B2W1E6_9BACT|nr:thiamine phosphate synthase [Chitinophaga agrisoli]KAA2244884.1 thiamine phosphate synthase [Chitinophaga agrisoli]